MTEEQKKKVEDIAYHYGEGSQCEKTVEECAELIVAIEHMKKKRQLPQDEVAALENLAGEIADVQIMCEQLAYLYGIGEVVKEQIEFKITRQMNRMQKGE